MGGVDFGRHLLNFNQERFSISREDFLELRVRSREFIFVVGSARSATTILGEIINMQRDCYMLMEDNPFINHYMEDYVSWYRAMTQEAGCKMAKGFYLPSFCSENISWAKIYLLLKEHYRLVGGKIALGPHGYWENVASNFLDFYVSIFPEACYLGCLRHPVECVESMAIMFKNRNLKELMETWIYSALYLVYMSCLFDRFYLVLHERLSEKFLNGILMQADVGEYNYLDKVLSPRKYVGYQFEELLHRAPLIDLQKERVADWTTLFLNAVNIYYDLSLNFDEVSSMLKPECQRTQFVADMDKRLRELLLQLHTL